MRHGIIVTTGGPREAAELAHEAEDAGWDGVFTWDAISVGSIDTWDPWVVMAAMAIRTERVRLGAIVTPPSRRRPWKLARETLTLDHLSEGRLVLPVGLGTLDDAGFGTVGEPTEARIRAELLDETLEILEGLWAGEPFAYEGRHYRFGAMTFRPPSVQRPRIPIWVVGAWPRERSMQRVLRYDGIVTQVDRPGDVAAIAAYVAERRPAELRDRGFEIVVQGTSDPAEADSVERVRAYLDAGATWWIESDWSGATTESLRRRIAAGPVRVA